MSQVIGKYYSWGHLSIFFDKSGILLTPWTNGVYEWLDDFTINASWSGLIHRLSFNKTFTEYTSIRTNDGITSNGSLVPFAKTSTIPSITIHYKDSAGELCYIGKKYNVDKSSQRENISYNQFHHCHPYSLLYDSLFRKLRNEPLNFCEIGVAEGHSLLMWEEYFPEAEIYGFEKFSHWLDAWNTKYSNKQRIHVNSMDVLNEVDIIQPLKNTGVLFDCILDDSSHIFNDMIRIIKCGLNYLKPGGIIIIEDIRKGFDEEWFYIKLKDILHEFQTVFFVELNHNRRNSGCINNDKVLILVKNGPQYFNFSLI